MIARHINIGSLALAGMFMGLAGCSMTSPPPKGEYVWPLPPEQPRIKFVRSVSSKNDFNRSGAELFMDALVGKKREPEGLSKPYGVHADKEGRVFVADTGLGKVAVFDFKNKKFSLWGEDGRGFLKKPAGVTSDSRGRVYVTDVSLDRAVVYDRDGNFLNAIGNKGELEQPVGIAVNEKLGRIYIVDTRKHHIAVFDMDGTLISTIGERGKEPGQFNFPTNLAIDKAGKLYVADTMNFRVQILDPDGKGLKTIGSAGDSFGTFTRPKGIAVDSEGHIYVTDAAFNNFQIFDQEGKLLLFVGSMGRSPGQFWLPAGMYIDAEDKIYVADQYNLRVQVFDYLKEALAEKKPADSAKKEPEQAEKKGGDPRAGGTEIKMTSQQKGGPSP